MPKSTVEIGEQFLVDGHPLTIGPNIQVREINHPEMGKYTIDIRILADSLTVDHARTRGDIEFSDGVEVEIEQAGIEQEPNGHAFPGPVQFDPDLEQSQIAADEARRQHA